MNIEETLIKHFGQDTSDKLSVALNLNPELTHSLLDRVVRLHVEKISLLAKNESGQQMIFDAMDKLPNFKDIDEALTEYGGINSLEIAGDILNQNLFHDDLADQANQFARVEGINPAKVHKIIKIVLPLVLSFTDSTYTSRQSILNVFSALRLTGLKPKFAGLYTPRAIDFPFDNDSLKKNEELEEVQEIAIQETIETVNQDLDSAELVQIDTAEIIDTDTENTENIDEIDTEKIIQTEEQTEEIEENIAIQDDLNDIEEDKEEIEHFEDLIEIDEIIEESESKDVVEESESKKIESIEVFQEVSHESLANAAAQAGVGAGAVVIDEQNSLRSEAKQPELQESILEDPELASENWIKYFKDQFQKNDFSAFADTLNIKTSNNNLAAQGTAVVVLHAIIQRMQSKKEEIVNLAESFASIATNGKTDFDASILSNPAAIGALEVHGITIMSKFFEDPSQAGARLGSALGISSHQSARLLAAFIPVMLGLLYKRLILSEQSKLNETAALFDQKLKNLLSQEFMILEPMLKGQMFGAKQKEKYTLLETKQSKATLPTEPIVSQPITNTQNNTKVAEKDQIQEMPEVKKSFPYWLLAIPLIAIGAFLATNKSQKDTKPAVQPENISPSSNLNVPFAPDNNSNDSVKGVYSITSPNDKEIATDKGFNIKGTVKPNTEYRLFENDIHLKTFKSDQAGNFQSFVPSVDIGNYTYTVKDLENKEVIQLPVFVQPSEARSNCGGEMTTSVNDGDTVVYPFRFGGLGHGSGYKIRVLKDGKEIGTQEIKLKNNCTWNYVAKLDEQNSKNNVISYEIYSLDSDHLLEKINLNIK